MKGDYEQEDFDFLRSLLPEDGVVFDIGNNAGIFSLSLAQEKKNLKIFAFEPLPSTYKKMQAKFRLNPDLAGKVQLYNKGLSKKHADIIKQYIIGRK
jgi:methyltransferase, fkbM family